MSEQDEIQLVKGDGTDALLTVLYGESSARTIGKALGGSQARMLFDAAEQIAVLREQLNVATTRAQRFRDCLLLLAKNCDLGREGRKAVANALEVSVEELDAMVEADA